jgi:hypothetical protein
MCSINHDLKAIYIHIPKCGGSFINNILEKYYNFTTILIPNENHNNFIPKFDNKMDKHDGDGDGDADEAEEADETTKNAIQNYYKNYLTITEQGFLRYNSSSELFNYVMDMTKEKWRDYKKFTIIRNPYDRFISAWNFINKMIKKKIQSSEQNILQIDEYINKSKNELFKYCQYAYSHSHISQYDHLLDTNNEFNIDYIGNFENLNEDLCNILLKIGVDNIKHDTLLKNNSKINANHHRSYIEYYDNTILEKVNKILQNDFDMFKQYKQVYSVEEMIEESKKHIVSNDTFIHKNQNLIEHFKNENLLEIDKMEKNIETKINDMKKHFKNKDEKEFLNTIKDLFQSFENNKNIKKIYTKPPIDSSTKLPVTNSNDAPRERAILNLRGYKSDNNNESENIVQVEVEVEKLEPNCLKNLKKEILTLCDNAEMTINNNETVISNISINETELEKLSITIDNLYNPEIMITFMGFGYFDDNNNFQKLPRLTEKIIQQIISKNKNTLYRETKKIHKNKKFTFNLSQLIDTKIIDTITQLVDDKNSINKPKYLYCIKIINMLLR